ncbi:hypothetical protein RTM1035_04460 [Roseovarius sp. TM1035]|nr:hypothetical protein RTM1035_04460 [Roseovarius sp. TM1035]
MPVGSSAKSTRGPLASARQKATRCCSPPDMAEGRCPARAPTPTCSNSVCARATASRRATPLASCGSTMFSSALNSGRRWWN